MKKQILYFIKGEVPTAEEIKAADKLRGKGSYVEYVSLVLIDLNGPIIENVGVAGAVPEMYKEFFLEPAPVIEDKVKEK